MESHTLWTWDFKEVFRTGVMREMQAHRLRLWMHDKDSLGFAASRPYRPG